MDSIRFMDQKLWGSATQEEKVAMVLMSRFQNGDVYFDESLLEWHIWMNGKFVKIEEIQD